MKKEYFEKEIKEMKKEYFEREIKECKDKISYFNDKIKMFPDYNKLRESRAYYEGCMDVLVIFSKIFNEIKEKYEKEKYESISSV